MQIRNQKNASPRHIIEIVADEVAAIFPYYLTFYFFSLFVSVFFKAWRGYFYWPAFNLSIICFALVGAASERTRIYFKKIAEISRIDDTDEQRAAVRAWNFFLRLSGALIVSAIVVPAGKKILYLKKILKKSDYVKITAIAAILAFSLFERINASDFAVMLFGLVSVLFGRYLKISVGCAFAFLAACPFLIAFNENDFAETAAVYAYYFFAIVVLAEIGEYMRNGASFAAN
jgi:hypothetical protein